MVIPKRHRIILKSKAAGNSEDGSNNSTTVFFEYISFPNLLAILVFQSGVLADSIFIDRHDMAILTCIEAVICVIFTVHSNTDSPIIVL